MLQSLVYVFLKTIHSTMPREKLASRSAAEIIYLVKKKNPDVGLKLSDAMRGEARASD